MKRFGLLLVAGLLPALGAVAAACGGGGGGPSLDQYFAQVDSVFANANKQFETLKGEFSAALEDPAAARDFYERASPILTDAVNSLKDIDPPKDAKAAHNEAVEAGESLQKVAADTFQQLKAANKTNETAVLELNNPKVTAALGRFDAACFALQKIADDKGIQVDLGCGQLKR